MPLKSKKRNATNNGRYRKHLIKSVFKRYNPEKVTLKGICNFLGYIFYRVGYEIEVNTSFIWSYLFYILNDIYSAIKNTSKTVLVFFNRLIDTVLDDLGEPIEKIGMTFHKVSTIIKESRKDKNRSTVKEVSSYLKQGVKKNRELTKTLQRYAMPVLSIALFVAVVNITLGKDYVLRVSLDDKEIGTIRNYTVLENADKIISNKLVTTDDQKWQPNTSIKITQLKEDEVIDERQLANNILRASDDNIMEASGLYVDGEFIGAVKNPEKLEEALDSLKAPYENGDENRKVSFVESVSVLDGIFFADTVVPDEELANLVVSEVSGAKYYTVVEGDSPWEIAMKNGITYNTLLSLNPNNDFSGLWPGDVVTVGASVPFLQVKYVETSTRQKEIPFKIQTEKNNSMALGTTKVTQKGENGINEELVESTYVDGVLQNEIVVQTTVIKEPVTQIVQNGTIYRGQAVEGGSGRIIWPTNGKVSRGFTGQYPAYHNGIDIAAPIGTPIYAADSGVVTKAVYTNRGYGVYCVIEHGGYQTLYGHCSQLFVSAGQQVQKGQHIAAMGSTGNSTGSHLHFEVKKGEYRYDPRGWL